MKISYNPKTAAVITTATAANDDILFDLNARKVWAKGLRMGADWADISSKPSSLKNPYALTISLNGTSQGPYDGSAAKSINITPSSIGAATSNHTHPYLPLSGGTMTGNIILKGGTSADMTYAGNAHPYIRFDNSDSSQNVSLIFTDYDIYRRPAGIKLVGNQGNEWFEAANIYATTFYGALSGNATTATTLQTARTIWGNSFDGTKDINGSIRFPNIEDTAISNKISWRGSTDGADIYYQTTAKDQGNLVLNVKDDTNAYIQLALDGVFKSHFDVANSYWTGRSAQADKWTTARTFTIGNTAKDVDGSGNVSWTLSEIGASPSGHNHDDIYIKKVGDMPTHNDIIISPTNLSEEGIDGGGGIHVKGFTGIPFQLWLHDTGNVWYKKTRDGAWKKMDAGHADTAGSVAWNNITGKPSSFIPSAHTHAWNSLTHSSTIENQAILTNGEANGWKLQTLNIANWDNAANNAHSHSNKSVLDGITSGLVTNWNTAYTFVSTITGDDTDDVINKWDEIVNFLAGIKEDNTLNTLLSSKLSIQQLAAKEILTTKTNNALYWVDTIGTAGSITTGPFTDYPYALLSVTNHNNSSNFYRSRLAFSSTGDLKVASCHHQGEYKQDDTWYDVLTSKNSGIDGSTIKLNGTSITVYSSSTADGRYVKKSGDTMTGALNFANNIWNQVGDDVAIGDHNIAGCLGIKGLNASPGLAFYNSSNTLLSKLVGTANQFQRISGDNNTYNILDNSTTHINDNTITINGTSLTVSKSDHTHNIYAVNENYGEFKKAERLPTSGFYQSNESESGGNAPWKSCMHLINCQHNNTGNNYALQIAASFYNNNTFKIRVTNNNVNNAWRDIIHSGNIGSQSVNYANSADNSDKLDGYHANGLLTALSNSNRGISLTVGGTTKSLSNISVGDADTVDGVHANQLCRIYTFDVHNSIIKVGTLTSGQQGHVCKLRFNSGIGYNAVNTDKTMTVVIRASNGNANSNGFYFEAHSESYRGGAFTTFYLYQTSKTQCELYMAAFVCSGKSTYEVSFSDGDLWTNEISVQNALPTSNIFTLLNYQIAYTDYNVSSATKVIVNQNTANDTNYPLVWSNQNNTSSATENQLHKSWQDLYYNPKNKRLFVGGSISTVNINATGTVTSAGFKHSGVTENADQYVLTADGSYTFLNQTSNESAHEFSKDITITSEWTDIEDFYGGNQNFLTQSGTYIVQVYYTTNSANSMYEGYFSGIMSWYTGTTNSNNADEIVLHRVGHAYVNTIYLRTRESLNSESQPYTKLQISANSDLKQHTYKFKFKRIC